MNEQMLLNTHSRHQSVISMQNTKNIVNELHNDMQEVLMILFQIDEDRRKGVYTRIILIVLSIWQV